MHWQLHTFRGAVAPAPLVHVDPIEPWPIQEPAVMLKRSPTAVEDQHWYLFLSFVVLYLPINPMSISTDWEIAVGGRRHPASNCLDLWSKIKLEPVFCLQVPPMHSYARTFDSIHSDWGRSIQKTQTDLRQQGITWLIQDMGHLFMAIFCL